MIYTVFDFETNGLIGKNGEIPDVLSYSAKKYDFNHETGERKMIGELENFYHTKNNAEILPKVTEVTGLTKEKIEAKRKELGTKADYFGDVEREELIKFMDDGDYTVAHNGNEFDYRVLMPEEYKGKRFEKAKTLDTLDIAQTNRLKTNTMRQGKTVKDGYYHGKKNPDLARYYGIEVDQAKLHNAANDVDVTADVFDRMLKDEKLETFFEEKEIKTGPKQTVKPVSVIKETGFKTDEFVDSNGKKIKKITPKLETSSRVSELAERAKTFGDEFAKLSKGKKAGLLSGIVLGTVGVGVLGHTVHEHKEQKRKAEEQKRKAEAQKKWETVMYGASQNRKNGGF